MFKSRQREIVTPQLEHARFTGELAYLWGNEEFNRPKLPFDAFVKGVTLHDRGYDPLDNDPIGDVPRERWLAIQQQGIERRCEDPIADIVALLHVRRLVSWNADLTDAESTMARADKRINQRLTETNFTRADFEWADHITNFVDSLAFIFAFEVIRERTLPVAPRVDSDATVDVTFHVGENGDIRVDPWVFSVESYRGFVLGYQAEGYPERLEPEIIPFHIHP